MSLSAVFIAINSAPIFLKVLIAFVAGMLPVLFWLWFWEHEDKHPEPKKLVTLAFISGMAGVFISLFLEQLVTEYVSNTSHTLILWAAIEELVKFGVAYVVVLRLRENDQPIDSMMYMIVVALGFSGLENALFLFKPLYESHSLDALITGNMRFIGATLLHTLASSIIGFSLALSFYRSKATRRHYVILGVVIAIVLHAAFNLSIIAFEDSFSILPFYAVWIAIIGILLAFEKVKRIKKKTKF